MKEVEVAYTDLELMQMGNDERAHVVSQRKMIGAGIGGLVLLAAAYSFFIAAKFFFLDIPLIEPLYFITSPFWCIPLMFLTRSVFFRTLLAIWVTVSLPFLFTFTFTIQDFHFGTSINFDYLFSNLSQFYELAYGDIGSKLQHLTISRALSLEQHKIFMSGIMLINSLVLVICFSMFYRICYDVILGFSKNKPTLEVNGFFQYLGGLFIVFATYFILAHLLILTKDLPFGLGIFIAWNVMFYPFLGIRLALTNSKRKTKDKIGTMFTRYYIVFGLVIFPLSLYLSGSLMVKIQGILSGSIFSILFFLPVILVPFFLYSLKDKKVQEQSD